MYTYCLFCETGKSKYVAGEATAHFGCKVIIPKQIQHTWSKGQMINRIRELLPGYVFLYSEELIHPSWTFRIPGVIRFLRTTDQKYELTEADEAFALFLLQADGVIGKTKVVRGEDGRLEISRESFKGAKVTILKVDHRAQRMQIEIWFAAQRIRTWIEYEEVSTESEIQEE